MIVFFLLENALKLIFVKILNPLHKTVTPSPIHIQNRTKKTMYGFIMACTEVQDRGRNSLSWWKTRIGCQWL